MITFYVIGMFLMFIWLTFLIACYKDDNPFTLANNITTLEIIGASLLWPLLIITVTINSFVKYFKNRPVKK